MDVNVPCITAALHFKRLRNIISVFLIVLLVLLPVSYAEQLNLVYDNNGNLVTGDGKYRYYNGFNQLIKVKNNSATGKTLEEYIYHPTEERVLAKRVYNLDSTNSLNQTVIYTNENLVRTVTYPAANQVNTSDRIYVKDETGLIVEIGSKSPKLFYSTDHLGSTSVITNSTGDVVEETFYEPFGQILSGGSVSRFDYEGKEFSTVTREYDFNFRKYDPDNRFYGMPDSIYSDIYDPQQLNRYSFERDNPYKYTDPDGHIFDTIVDAGFIVYDVYKLATEGAGKNNENLIALGADIVGAAIPGATGLGLATRTINKADEAAVVVSKVGELTKAERLAENIQNANTVEGAVRAEQGGIKQGFETSQGRRVIDSYVESKRTATEVKVGEVTNNPFVKAQIQKDVKLLKQGQLDYVTYASYQSPVTGKSGFSKGIKKFIKDITKKAGVKIKTVTKQSKGKKK